MVWIEVFDEGMFLLRVFRRKENSEGTYPIGVEKVKVGPELMRQSVV